MKPKRFGKNLAAFVAVAALMVQPAYSLLASKLAAADSLNVVHSSNLSGWYLGESKSGGHSEIVSNGLHVWTTGGSSDGSNRKAAGYRSVAPFPLADASSSDITFVSSTGPKPSLQLGVDIDGDGDWDGYLVYEPWSYGDGNWWTSKNFGLPSGQGYEDFGTIAQFAAANPNAKVISLGYSLGTLGNHPDGDSVISKLTVGDTDYTFGVNIPACSADDSTFDTSTNGSVNGQYGWKSTGSYDQAVVDNTYDITTFGCKSLRISNAVTSGSFGDQTFSYSTANEAGDTDAENGGQSGGTRQSHYEAQFDIASTRSAQQSGLSISVSPDRGDGARMSYLRFEDKADGIHVFFNEVTTSSNPANWNETDITTLSRTAPHTIKISIDFADGPSNDVVKVYVDGTLKITGTSWENYYRYDDESNPTLANASRTVDSLLFRAAGTAAPATSGAGYLIDNVTIATSTPAPDVPTGLSYGSPARPCGATTNINFAKPIWNVVAGAVSYDYQALYNGSVVFSANYATNQHPGGAFGSGQNGQWAFQVRSVNAAGVKSAWSTSCVITLDTVAPLAPSNLSWKTSTNKTIANNGATNVSDGTAQWQPSSSSDVQYYVYKYWNDIVGNQYKVGSEYVTTTVSASLPGVFNQGEGVHHFCVAAVDAAGNTSTCTNFTIAYDKTKPTVQNLALNSTLINGNSIILSGKVNDDNLLDYQVRVQTVGHVNTTPFIGASGTVNTDGTLATLNIGALPDGNYTLRLWATDRAGNSTGNDGITTYYLPFTIDRTKPVVTIDSAVRASDGSYTVNGTSDGTSLVTVLVDGIVTLTTTPVAGVWTVTTPILADGNHTITASSTDAAGNTGDATPAPYTFTATTPVARSFTNPNTNQGAPANQQLFAVVQQTPTAVADDQAVLGAQDSEASDTSGDSSQAVKGDTDTKTTDGNAGKFFGLLWYWWLVILAVIIALWWIIAAARRRKQDEN